MTKPKFLQIKKYEGDYMEDDVNDVIDWIHKTCCLKIIVQIYKLYFNTFVLFFNVLMKFRKDFLTGAMVLGFFLLIFLFVFLTRRLYM